MTIISIEETELIRKGRWGKNVFYIFNVISVKLNMKEDLHFAENCASQGFVYVPPEDIIVPWQRVISIVKQ